MSETTGDYPFPFSDPFAAPPFPYEAEPTAQAAEAECFMGAAENTIR